VPPVARHIDARESEGREVGRVAVEGVAGRAARDTHGHKAAAWCGVTVNPLKGLKKRKKKRREKVAKQQKTEIS
jgi:hypothetical protein